MLCRLPAALVPRLSRRCLQQRKLTTTYYDSQSGMHVSVHNQNEVSVFCHANNALEMDSLQRAGMNGAILSSDVLIPWNAPGFLLFTQSLPPYPPGQWNLLVDYCEESANAGDLSDRLSHYVSNDIKTTISLLDTINYVRDPIEVSSEVASLIDQTAGGNFILVGGSSDVDDIVALCEELVYLDVPGPTIKSRLIVDLTDAVEINTELMEETISMGVNKFVIQEHWFEWFQLKLDDLGKHRNVAITQ
jgi:hypothetical protein